MPSLWPMKPPPSPTYTVYVPSGVQIEVVFAPWADFFLPPS